MSSPIENIELKEVLVVVGWVIVPLLTAYFTFLQQKKTRDIKKAQDLLDCQSKELDDLRVLATKFWLSDASKKENEFRNIEILNILKKLESSLPKECRSDLTDLRQTITGGDFGDMNRKALSREDRKFLEISNRISEIIKKLS